MTEHRAAADSQERTASVESNAVFGMLFLYNNLHVVHHLAPTTAWYELPQLYRENRERYLQVNGGYRFTSYWQMAGRYLFRSKAPVPHPFLRAAGGE